MIRKRRAWEFVLGTIGSLGLVLGAAAAAAVPPRAPIRAEPFPLKQVRLLDGPFKHAMELDRRYLLSLDVDRLLHCFRVNAGLPSQAKPLGGWEEPKSEVRGHSVGHYLSACAMMVASTGDAALKAKADRVVAGLAECQAKFPSGYLSAYPEEFIERVEAGKPVWAPWYTLHKIYAGLIDMYVLCDNAQALEIARKMADYRQNVALISPLRLAAYAVDNGHFTIDFSRFDRMVRIFIEEGVIGRIEGGHIGGRAGAWETPFVVDVPEIVAGKTEFKPAPLSDVRARNFYSQFFPALVSHLDKEGWSGIYVQHLADEPTQDNFTSYVEIAQFVRQYAPNLKFIEACHTTGLAGMLNVWVPQLNFFDTDGAFYKDAAAKGAEVWFYTCVFPQGEYANRFIEQPLIKTRLLHWINFRYDSPGYLHWGFNFWSPDPFGEASRIQTESGLVLPAGDSWIVYPAPGKLLSSIRIEAMRDGIVDHELLCRLEAKRPADARELARQVVYGFTTYDIDLPSFREKRRMILKMLSE